MAVITVKDKEFTTLLTNDQIAEQIDRIAEAINTDYKDKNPLFLPVLNGSFMFASELFKRLTINTEISFIKLASYKGSSQGKVNSIIGLSETIYNRDIIVLEDIIDSGNTMSVLLEELESHFPSSIRLAALLYKPDAFKKDFKIDYTCFDIPDKFVIGFGLDYDGLGRNLTDVYSINSQL